VEMETTDNGGTLSYNVHLYNYLFTHFVFYLCISR
jgi:hypothetical protein